MILSLMMVYLLEVLIWQLRTVAMDRHSTSTKVKKQTGQYHLSHWSWQIT